MATESQEMVEFASGEDNNEQLLGILQVRSEEGSGSDDVPVQFVQSADGSDGNGALILQSQAIELNGERHVILQQAHDSETGELLVVLQGENGEQIALSSEALQSGLVQVSAGSEGDQVITLAVSQDSGGSQMVVVSDPNTTGTVALSLDSLTSNATSSFMLSTGASATNIPSQNANTSNTSVVQSVDTPRMTTLLEESCKTLVNPETTKDNVESVTEEKVELLTSVDKREDEKKVENSDIADTNSKNQPSNGSIENDKGDSVTVSIVNEETSPALDTKIRENTEEVQNENNSIDYTSAVIHVQDSNTNAYETLMANAAVVSAADNNYVIMTTEDSSMPTEINLADMISAGSASGQTFFIETSEGLVACTSASTNEDGSIQIVTDGGGALISASQPGEGQVLQNVAGNQALTYAVQSTATGIELTPVNNYQSSVSAVNKSPTKLKPVRQTKPKPVTPAKGGETILLPSSVANKPIITSPVTVVSTNAKKRPVTTRTTKGSTVNVTVTSQPSNSSHIIPVQPDHSSSPSKCIPASSKTAVVTSSLLTATAPGPSQLAASRRTYSKKNNIVWLNPEQTTVTNIPRTTIANTVSSSSSVVTTTAPMTTTTTTHTPIKSKPSVSVFSGTKSSIPPSGLTIVKADSTPSNSVENSNTQNSQSSEVKKQEIASVTISPCKPSAKESSQMAITNAKAEIKTNNLKISTTSSSPIVTVTPVSPKKAPEAKESLKSKSSLGIESSVTITPSLSSASQSLSNQSVTTTVQSISVDSELTPVSTTTSDSPSKTKSARQLKTKIDIPNVDISREAQVTVTPTTVSPKVIPKVSIETSPSKNLDSPIITTPSSPIKNVTSSKDTKTNSVAAPIMIEGSANSTSIVVSTVKVINDSSAEVESTSNEKLLKNVHNEAGALNSQSSTVSKAKSKTTVTDSKIDSKEEGNLEKVQASKEGEKIRSSKETKSLETNENVAQKVEKSKEIDKKSKDKDKDTKKKPEKSIVEKASKPKEIKTVAEDEQNVTTSGSNSVASKHSKISDTDRRSSKTDSSNTGSPTQSSRLEGEKDHDGSKVNEKNESNSGKGEKLEKLQKIEKKKDLRRKSEVASTDESKGTKTRSAKMKDSEKRDSAKTDSSLEKLSSDFPQLSDNAPVEKMSEDSTKNQTSTLDSVEAVENEKRATKRKTEEIKELKPIESNEKTPKEKEKRKPEAKRKTEALSEEHESKASKIRSSKSKSDTENELVSEASNANVLAADKSLPIETITESAVEEKKEQSENNEKATEETTTTEGEVVEQQEMEKSKEEERRTRESKRKSEASQEVKEVKSNKPRVNFQLDTNEDDFGDSSSRRKRKKEEPKETPKRERLGRRSSKKPPEPEKLTPILKKTPKTPVSNKIAKKEDSIVKTYCNTIDEKSEELERRRIVTSIRDTRSPAESYDYTANDCHFHIRHQSASLTPFTPRGSGASYMCQKCGYKTTRMNNLILHHKDQCPVVKSAVMRLWENEIRKQTKKPAENSTPTTEDHKAKRRRLDLDAQTIENLDTEADMDDKDVEKVEKFDAVTNDKEDAMKTMSADPVLIPSDEEEEALSNDSMKKSFGFDEKEIVWAEDEGGIHWPALVTKLHDKEKEVTLKLIDSTCPKKNVKMSVEKVKPFDNAEVNKRLLSEGKAIHGDIIVKAVQKAEDYSRKRCLGDEIGAAKLFEDLNEYQPLSDEERLDDERLEDNSIENCVENSGKDKSDALLRMSPAVESEDSITYSDSENLAQWKERRRISNSKLLQCIKDGKIENHLLGVYRETIPSERHTKFKSGSDADKSQLKDVPWFGPIDDEDQQEEIYDYCSQLFKSNFKPDGSFDTVAYLFEVWVPEAIVKAISRIRRIELKDAEAIFAKGVILSKSEQVEIEKEIASMKETEKQATTNTSSE